MGFINLSSRFVLATIATSLFGCAVDQGTDESAGIAEQAVSVPATQQYYTVTPDMRLCASPKCGGFFIKAVNQKSTTCADGTVADSCYVAAIDYRAMGGDPQVKAATVVVKGKQTLVDYGALGKFGQLIALDAWGSATSVVPSGIYYRMQSQPIVCITAPCFNIKAETLNVGTITSLSSYDLSRVGATREQIAAAVEAMKDGRLLASGGIVSVPPTTRPGRQLNATQFFLPPLDLCYSDSDCAKNQTCNASTVCLPPPGCNPAVTSCPAVCTGYCISLVANCISDADCTRDQFCDTDPCLPPPGCTPGGICPTVCGGVCTGRI